MANILIGSEQESVSHNAPLVYRATHSGQGTRFPDHVRSFISFSYGGKYIEDFDLIAYCNGSTMERTGSAEFEDLTSSYDILDGETYHGTHFKPFQLSLFLATDGITLKLLEKFKSWFRGGITRRLILSEHPNRVVYARILSPPALHLVPFEMPFTMPIGVDEKNAKLLYDTVSTLYKGTIDITFISSEPFWTAVNHIVGEWTDSGEFDASAFNGNAWSKDKDLLRGIAKIVYEDNIPLAEMASGDTRMAFGWTGVEAKVSLNTTIPDNGSYTPATRKVSTRSISTSKTETSLIVIIEKAHRPIALPDGSSEFARFDNIIAWADPESNGDPNITGEFKWWEPWNWNDTFDSSLTGLAFIDLYPDRDYVNYRGARVLPDSAAELIIETYSIKGGTSGSNIVDAYKYPQVLGKTSTNEYNTDWDEEDEDDGRGVVTRGLTKGNTRKSNDEDESASAYYFFYGGTAPSPAKVSFKLPLEFTSNNLEALHNDDKKDKRYIKSIANSYELVDGLSYSTITIEGTYTKKISMTTPNIMTSYNKVINIIKNSSEWNVVDLLEKIRDEIRHPHVRAYALKALQALIDFENDEHRYNGKYTKIPADSGPAGIPDASSGEPHRRVWASMMSSFWYNNASSRPIEIIIDSLTSKATGEFWFRVTPNFEVKAITGTHWLDYTNSRAKSEKYKVKRTEDIGDALRTTWYYIDDRNEYKEIFDEKGNLVGYTVAPWEDTIDGRSYSHKVTSDFPVQLKDFSIDYEYKYL